jgi:uncharacterized protein (TIGR02265 family)
MHDAKHTEAEGWAVFRAEMDARLAKLKPSDTTKGLFLRGYLEVYRKEGGEEFHDRCMRELGEKRVVDVFNYPYSGVMRIGLLGAELLAPKLGIHNYLRQMGRLATDRYFNSVLGKGLLSLVQPSPKKILGMMPAAVATCFSFGKRTVEFPKAGECLFHCRDDFSPAQANAGALEAAILATGGSAVELTVSAQDPFNYDVHARWKE